VNLNSTIDHDAATKVFKSKEKVGGRYYNFKKEMGQL